MSGQVSVKLELLDCAELLEAAELLEITVLELEGPSIVICLVQPLVATTSPFRYSMAL